MRRKHRFRSNINVLVFVILNLSRWVATVLLDYRVVAADFVVAFLRHRLDAAAQEDSLYGSY